MSTDLPCVAIEVGDMGGLARHAILVSAKDKQALENGLLEVIVWPKWKRNEMKWGDEQSSIYCWVLNRKNQ